MLTRSVAIVSEVLVLAATWMKTADMWKMSQLVTSFKPKLTTLLIRDGEFTSVLSERRLTCLRCTVLCVSILSEIYLARPADKYLYLKCIVYTEYRGPANGRARS